MNHKHKAAKAHAAGVPEVRVPPCGGSASAHDRFEQQHHASQVNTQCRSAGSLDNVAAKSSQHLPRCTYAALAMSNFGHPSLAATGDRRRPYWPHQPYDRPAGQGARPAVGAPITRQPAWNHNTSDSHGRPPVPAAAAPLRSDHGHAGQWSSQSTRPVISPYSRNNYHQGHTGGRRPSRSRSRSGGTRGSHGHHGSDRGHERRYHDRGSDGRGSDGRGYERAHRPREREYGSYRGYTDGAHSSYRGSQREDRAYERRRSRHSRDGSYRKRSRRDYARDRDRGHRTYRRRSHDRSRRPRHRRYSQSNRHRDRRRRGHDRRRSRAQSYSSSDNSSDGDDDEFHYELKENEILGSRYVVKRQLGIGTFGKVIECVDMHPKRAPPTNGSAQPTASSTQGQQLVAVKVVRAVRRYSKSAVTEVGIVVVCVFLKCFDCIT